MSDCQYYNSGKCVVASHLANGLECFVNEHSCAACSSSENPMGENKVTASIAAAHLYKAKIDLPDDLMNFLGISTKRLVEHAPDDGVGFELARLISWFYVDTDPCLICKYRMQKMNVWGPDVCEEKIETILVWLKQAANKRRIPYVDFAVRLLLKKAIANARRKCCGDNCSKA